MRILLSCQQALKPHAVPAYAYWEYYFKNALKEAGHEVVEVPGVDWAEGLTVLSREERSDWLERTWASTVGFLQAERPLDLFLSYLFPNQVEPAAINEIRAKGIPCVNFFCDNVREFSRVPSSFGCFDLHWVPEAEAGSLYAAAQLAHIYAPMPMWVRPEFRVSPVVESEGVVFVGSQDPLRASLLGEAIALGLPLEIYGSGWKAAAKDVKPAARTVKSTISNQWAFLRSEGMTGWVMRATSMLRRAPPSDLIALQAHPPLGGDMYFQKTRQAQVVLGVNRCPSFRRPFWNPIRYSRLRDIEAPMLGACYLAEMAPGLEDLYEIGTEIETYRNADELVEKAQRLQSDPAMRLRLRQHGQRRALSDHTIARSIKRIAERLGLAPR